MLLLDNLFDTSVLKTHSTCQSAVGTDRTITAYAMKYIERLPNFRPKILLGGPIHVLSCQVQSLVPCQVHNCQINNCGE